jgi:AraC-like DNA-binding protein
MSDVAFTVEALVRGCAIGALVATAFAICRSAPGRHATIAFALMALTTCAYMVEGLVYRMDLPGWLLPLHLLSMSGAAFVWLFIGALYDDWKVTLRTLAPAMVLMAVGSIGLALPPGALRRGLFLVHNLAEVALAFHALSVIQRSWAGDLVEARRLSRGPLLVAVLVFVLLQAGAETLHSVGLFQAWLDLLGGVAVAGLALTGAWLFLRAQPEVFGVARPAAAEAGAAAAAAGAGAGASAADRLEIDRLNAHMEAGAWREEGLTIGALADAIQIPEHRLRRLINNELGHRNFAAFLNTWRMRAAREILTDPAHARRTVSSIAFDLGFGSLAPFNRAFKDATGQTPTEYRRAAAGMGGRETGEGGLRPLEPEKS